MVDIKKLEKLSCLNLSDEVKEKVATSIDGVMAMIKEIESENMPVLKSKEYTKTALSVEANERMYDRKQNIPGIHLEDSMFLAPKVIKK